jgi:hypothetical protein
MLDDEESQSHYRLIRGMEKSRNLIPDLFLVFLRLIKAQEIEWSLGQHLAGIISLMSKLH